MSLGLVALIVVPLSILLLSVLIAKANYISEKENHEFDLRRIETETAQSLDGLRREKTLWETERTRILEELERVRKDKDNEVQRLSKIVDTLCVPAPTISIKKENKK